MGAYGLQATASAGTTATSTTSLTPDASALTGLVGAPPGLPAKDRMGPSAAETERLVDLIGKAKKTPAEKRAIVQAVFDRIERRIEELKLEEARTHDSQITDKRKALEALVRNLNTLDFKEDPFGFSDSWAYHSKLWGTNVIYLSEDFFRGLVAPSGDDQADMLDVWLGERAATLAHEYEHTNQWIPREKPAYAQTKRMLEIINEPAIESINSRRAANKLDNYPDSGLMKESTTRLESWWP